MGLLHLLHAPGRRGDGLRVPGGWTRRGLPVSEVWRPQLLLGRSHQGRAQRAGRWADMEPMLRLHRPGGYRVCSKRRRTSRGGRDRPRVFHPQSSRPGHGGVCLHAVGRRQPCSPRTRGGSSDPASGRQNRRRQVRCCRTTACRGRDRSLRRGSLASGSVGSVPRLDQVDSRPRPATWAGDGAGGNSPAASPSSG